MDVEELMKRAWEAVQKSGVPEPLQAVALKEAVDFLKAEEGVGREEEDLPGDDSKPSEPGRTAGRASRGRKPAAASKQADKRLKVPVPDESTFFSRLADESGVDEQDLRDVLRLEEDGTVLISPATKNLGSSKAQQSKSVIALMGGARAFGLGEDPVDADAVRTEAKRKRCFQENNFATGALAPMRGFNAGSHRNEIVLTSKWIEEFSAAVDKALGRTDKKGDDG